MALQACSQATQANAAFRQIQGKVAAPSPKCPSGLRHSLPRRSFIEGKKVAAACSPTSRAPEPFRGTAVCGLTDFVGGDLIGLDLGQWCDDVENYGAVGFWAPPEGGAECRYGSSLKYRGYHFMYVHARGLGDPEAYLLKTHGVRPPHLGKQAVARFYQPGEVDLRLAVLPPRYKGIVLWVYEAKVLSKNELQFLALLPALRPQVKVVVEMGGDRKFRWQPLKDIVGLPASANAAAAAAAPFPTQVKQESSRKEEAVASS